LPGGWFWQFDFDEQGFVEIEMSKSPTVRKISARAGFEQRVSLQPTGFWSFLILQI
jgi:hypothetical protein